MTPIFLNSSSNNYWTHDLHHQDDHFSNNQDFLNPNSQPSSSSNSLTTHMFFNSTPLDENGVLHRELQPPQHQQHEGDSFGSQVYKDDRIENNNGKGHEFPTWDKCEMNNMINKDQNQVKWMSSKMRVMLKMKKSDPVNPINRSIASEVKMFEDHKLPNSPIDQETDNSSNSTTSNNIVPIRVCSDCNTTKTPLWRSGPRGPKSLCNACGIRQRKARRAAMAAAQNGNNNVSIDQSIMVPLKVTKAPHKDHKKPSNNNGHVTKYKKIKRQYSKQIITIPTPTPSSSPSPSPLPSPPSSSSPARKNHVEEFLVSLSKNLTFYRVFPQDEKEAAILLMALSCGYAHEI